MVKFKFGHANTDEKSLDAILATNEKSHRNDAEHHEDVQNAKELAHDMSEMTRSYFFSVGYLGTMFSFSLTALSAYYGFSCPASILSYINEDIGPSNSESLFSIVWTMCNAISLLTVGRVTDRFGKRNIILGAGVLVIVGAAVASQAQNMNTLIGANVCIGLPLFPLGRFGRKQSKVNKVLIGMASGAHSAVGLFIGELSPHRYKFVIQAFVLIPMVFSPGLGAYIGRALVETRSWRWTYYILIIITGVGWLLQIIFYHPPTFRQLHGEKRSMRRELQRMDHLGLFLLVAGLTMFLLGVSWGGNPKPWHSGLILGLLITGGVLLVVFVLWEAYTPSPNPIVDLKLFKHRGYVCLNIISACSGAMYVGLSIIWPQYVFRVFSSAETSWKTEAWMSTTVGWGIWGGLMIMCPLVHIIGNIKYQLLGCAIFSTAFLIALSQVNTNERGQAIAFSFLAGLPVGFLELGPCVICQLGAPDVDIGMVFGVISSVRSVAGSVFTAIYIAVLNSKAKSYIANQVPAAAIAAGLPKTSLMALFEALHAGSAAAMANVPGINAKIEAAVSQAQRSAYADAFRYVYYAALAPLICAIIAAFFLPNYNKYMTGYTPKALNNSKNVFRDKKIESDGEKA